ncbi:MAG: hypothetical protein D6793_12780 [Thermoflexia bacterium]|nr:MAG: hypothetical protein D6793_12780 [Thermoflexia bacterium]
MENPRVRVLSALGFLALLAGLMTLALPGPYEGTTLLAMDFSHAVQTMDLVGVGLLLLGSALVLGAGWTWQRWMYR